MTGSSERKRRKEWKRGTCTAGRRLFARTGVSTGSAGRPDIYIGTPHSVAEDDSEMMRDAVAGAFGTASSERDRKAAGGAYPSVKVKKTRLQDFHWITALLITARLGARGEDVLPDSGAASREGDAAAVCAGPLLRRVMLSRRGWHRPERDGWDVRAGLGAGDAGKRARISRDRERICGW